MKHELINLSKLKKAAVLTFQNCLRLHFDSILLFSSGSFPSGFSLSILALEEFGKYVMLEDFIWHSETDGRLDPKGEQEALQYIYQHSIKQRVFANNFKWFPEAFIGTMGDLFQAIKTDGEPSIGGADNLKTLELVFACYKSAKERRAIRPAEIS